MSDLLQGVSVFLIGMMGSGKSTVGQVLAQQLNYRFFDTDELIIRVKGKSINDIFAREGENGFREVESQILMELCAYTRSVIATGGGIVLKQQNWSYLKHGLIVWLDAPVPLLCQRLAEDQTRPLLQDSSLASRLDSILAQRRSLYTQADLQLTIAGDHTPEQLVSQLMEMIPAILKDKDADDKFNQN